MILEDCAGLAGLGAAPRTDQGHRANRNIVWKSWHARRMTQGDPNANLFRHTRVRTRLSELFLGVVSEIRVAPPENLLVKG